MKAKALIIQGPSSVHFLILLFLLLIPRIDALLAQEKQTWQKEEATAAAVPPASELAIEKPEDHRTSGRRNDLYAPKFEFTVKSTLRLPSYSITLPAIITTLADTSRPSRFINVR